MLCLGHAGSSDHLGTLGLQLEQLGAHPVEAFLELVGVLRLDGGRVLEALGEALIADLLPQRATTEVVEAGRILGAAGRLDGDSTLGRGLCLVAPTGRLGLRRAGLVTGQLDLCQSLGMGLPRRFDDRGVLAEQLGEHRRRLFRVVHCLVHAGCQKAADAFQDLAHQMAPTCCSCNHRR